MKRRTLRSGITLLELMIVTTIIGILAMIAARPMVGIRERSMAGAARFELRQVMTAVELYAAVNGAWPPDMQTLKTLDFQWSNDIVFCRFELVGGTALSTGYILLEAQHRRSRRRVQAQYPGHAGAFEETTATTHCADGAVP